MRAVHELFTNTRMDGEIFVHSWSYSWMVVWARVESLPVPVLFGERMSPSGIISEAGRQVEGLFESLLSENFG